MARNLNNSFSVHKLVTDLGRSLTSDPVGEILQYCDDRIRTYLQDFSDCNTLSELLEIVSAKLGTLFEEIHTDADIQSIKQRYLIESKDLAFLNIEKEFSNETFGATFKRLNREDWEPEYVSVIDCRGEKALRSYFTKWHEIAHLLVLTQPERVIFKRTHSLASQQDAEENLMDRIASEFGFYSQIIRPHISGNISFEYIKRLQEQLCQNASNQSVLIGFTKSWPNPCLSLRAEMGLKKEQAAKKDQQSFFFIDEPKEFLRVIKITSSNSARERKFRINENMRVPQCSVIYRVFEEQILQAEAEEDLSWWETSSGTVLPQTRIWVQARRASNGIDAIIYPLD